LPLFSRPVKKPEFPAFFASFPLHYITKFVHMGAENFSFFQKNLVIFSMLSSFFAKRSPLRRQSSHPARLFFFPDD